jgi:iron complex outermembrane recepter protein
MNSKPQVLAGIVRAAIAPVHRPSVDSVKTLALIAASTLTLALGTSGAARADDADAASAAGVEEVTVTGSRIQRDGMTTPTPVTQLSANDLQLLAPTTLGEAVTKLPQFIGNAVPEGAPTSGWTGASGATILNLRGIGANRTLVLLDGRRVVSSTRTGTLDINLIPQALLKDMEVVTGGASAAYGSDAVSGVVNFILDTKFTGFKADVQGGETHLNDDRNYRVSLTAGTAIGDRLHLVASADFYHVQAIRNAFSRDWEQSWGVIANPLFGRAGQPQRITAPNARSTQYTEGGLITSGPLAFTQFLPGGATAPFVKGADFTASAQSGGDGVDPLMYNYLTPQNERASAFTHITYDVTDHVHVFVQGLYGLNDTSYLSPPAGAQFSTWGATIYSGNPYLPSAVQQQMNALHLASFKFGRAGDLDYGGDKTIEQDNALKSFTTGVSADIGNWKLDGYYQYGRTNSTIFMDGAIRLDRVYQAMDAVLNPANGNIVCRSTLMYPGNGCVPMDVFGAGSPSQAAIDWLTQDVSQKQVIQQHVAELTMSGSPFRDWAGDVSTAFGGSWRQDWFSQVIYPIDLNHLSIPANTPALGYLGLPAVYAGNSNIFERGPSASPAGGYRVSEEFVEAQVPLLSQQPFAKELDFNAAARYAHYSGSGGIWAWKGGLDWSVNSDVRFRVTRSRDVRAGTLSERFDTSRGPGNVTDTQSGSPLPYAVSVINAGNPNVNPEKADTLTYGVVFQPTWLDGFAASVDAFDIKIAGAIGQLGAQAIVDQCRLGATQVCQQIVRGTDGFISLIRNSYINMAQARARGEDFELSYRHGIHLFGGGEHFTARLLASNMRELSTQQPGAAPVDRAGQTGPGGSGGTVSGVPHWQGTATFQYEQDRFGAAIDERFIEHGSYDSTWRQGVDIDDNHVPGVMYTNLQLSYRPVRGDRLTTEIDFNVSNLMNRDPPRAATFGFTGSTYTNTQLFDIYGRTYTLGVKVQF